MTLTLEQAVVQLDRDVEGQLRQAGVTGLAHSCTECPVAVWLSQVTGLVVEVRFRVIRVKGAKRGIPMPPNIKRFVTYFDAGYIGDFRQ